MYPQRLPLGFWLAGHENAERSPMEQNLDMALATLGAVPPPLPMLE